MEKPRQGRPLAVGPQRWEPRRVAAAPDSPQPVHVVQAQGLTHLQRGTLRVDGTMSILPALLCLSQWRGQGDRAAGGNGETTPPCLWRTSASDSSWVGALRGQNELRSLGANLSQGLSSRAESGSKDPHAVRSICAQEPRPIPVSAPGAEDSSSTDCVFSLPATAPFILSPVT